MLLEKKGIDVFERDFYVYVDCILIYVILTVVK